MQDSRLAYTFDADLREVPSDLAGMEKYVQELQESLAIELEHRERVRRLGELGVYLRILNQLDSAEKSIRHALAIVDANNFGVGLRVQNEIRLGNILQWKKSFVESNLLFEKTIEQCRSHLDGKKFLGFALQHAGKNLFDQKKFQEALDLFQECLALRERMQSPVDQLESTRFAILMTRNKLKSL